MLGQTNKFKKNHGFTLIEVLVYSVLLAFIMTGVMGAVYMIVQGFNRSSATVTADDEANFILRKLNWAMSCATSVTLPARGATTNTLRVWRNNIAPGDNPLFFDLNSATSTIRIRRGAGALTDLNSLQAASLSFQRTPSAQPDKIKAIFYIDGRQFETSKYIRTCI